MIENGVVNDRMLDVKNPRLADEQYLFAFGKARIQERERQAMQFGGHANGQGVEIAGPLVERGQLRRVEHQVREDPGDHDKTQSRAPGARFGPIRPNTR